MTFPRDRARFVKLMMLSTSDNDAEALAALRKAHAMLRGSGMNWEELLALPLIEDEPEPAPPPPRRDTRRTWTSSAFVRRSDMREREQLLLHLRDGASADRSGAQSLSRGPYLMRT